MTSDVFLKSLHVSRETIDRLILYRDLLFKWQRAVNLVSSKTLPEAWDRHFVDSAQILPLMPDGMRVVVDLGSGAGFPGLVLAILDPALEVHLVESDDKKCQFLRTVSRETRAGATVHYERIEKIYDHIMPDVVTARALADLKTLCGYVLPWAEKNPALQMVFMKGSGAEAEMEEALKYYNFSWQSTPSITDPAAYIITIRDLKRKAAL